MKKPLTFLAAALTLAAICIPQPLPASAAVNPTVDPTPIVTVKIPGNPPPRVHWRDAPPTPGNWSYASGGENTSATFAISGSKPHFRISCGLNSKKVTLTLFGIIAAKGELMAIHTSSLERKLSTDTPDRAVFETLSYLESSDELLDAMALASDRFAVELGRSLLLLPSSPEVARVIEDCR